MKYKCDLCDSVVEPGNTLAAQDFGDIDCPVCGEGSLSPIDEGAKLKKRLDPYLSELWEDFLLWNTGKHDGEHDDQAEKFVKDVGAVDDQPIAFMAFVAGREWK